MRRGFPSGVIRIEIDGTCGLTNLNGIVGLAVRSVLTFHAFNP
jgi:hypothetical protein